jgi:hypothetical protein
MSWEIGTNYSCTNWNSNPGSPPHSWALWAILTHALNCPYFGTIQNIRIFLDHNLLALISTLFVIGSTSIAWTVIHGFLSRRKK